VRSRELREATEKVMGANATAKQYPCVGALRSWRGPCVQVTGSFSLLFWLTAATYTSCGVLWNMCMKGEKLYPQTMPTAPGAFSDSFDANRTSRVWHGGDREGPLNEPEPIRVSRAQSTPHQL
jgi:hypothetical protein